MLTSTTDWDLLVRLKNIIIIIGTYLTKIIIGFLSTEDNVVPGNNGLRDQILALKWIKAHIEYFGGDSNSITISGMSAGGASVQFHYLIPEARGNYYNYCKKKYFIEE